MTRNKIILADDHQFLLEGIMSVLKDVPSVEVVAAAQNGLELMEEVDKQKPSLVILDLNMPGYDGMQCLQKIKSNYPGIKVLILTNYNQPELVKEIKKMQAEGYMIKNSSGAELKKAIEIILSGETYFPSDNELKALPDDSFFFDDFLKKFHLTRREVNIIHLICREMSTKEIAAELFLSELTVNTHRRNIFRKLDVRNVAGLINFAKQNQLL